MKTLALFVILSLSQMSSLDYVSTNETVDEVAVVFQKNLKPYLEKFVDLQYPSINQNNVDQKLLAKSSVAMYLQKASIASEKLANEILKMKKDQITKESVFLVFDRMYRYEFPGLDYIFFEKVKKDLSL